MDFHEELGVNFAHDLRGEHGCAVFGWKEFVGGLIVGPRTLGLKAHQRDEGCVVFCPCEGAFRVSEARQVFLREVDAVLLPVHMYVSHDVGQLQGEAQVDGIFPGLRVGIAKNFNAD